MRRLITRPANPYPPPPPLASPPCPHGGTTEHFPGFASSAPLDQFLFLLWLRLSSFSSSHSQQLAPRFLLRLNLSSSVIFRTGCYEITIIGCTVI
ncbi:hypothetical protein K1719_002052 [Acacia pycnantha]|nr:hypothetical protein K1719_002052 [Acacia pycnantha]